MLRRDADGEDAHAEQGLRLHDPADGGGARADASAEAEFEPGDEPFEEHALQCADVLTKLAGPQRERQPAEEVGVGVGLGGARREEPGGRGELSERRSAVAAFGVSRPNHAFTTAAHRGSVLPVSPPKNPRAPKRRATCFRHARSSPAAARPESGSRAAARGGQRGRGARYAAA